MSISSNQAQHRAPSRRGQSAATTGRSSASRRPTQTEHHVTERTYSIRDEIASLSSGRGPDRSARPATSAKSVPTARPAARPASPAKRPASAKASPVQRHQRNERTQPSPQGKGRVKQYIDPARFVRKAKEVVREVYAPTHSFDDFAVDRRIIANLRAKGYVDPTPIQDQTIQLVLDGHDVVGIANTGTGKTAAFSVPLIHDLMGNRENRLLVLAPTRELAQQIVDEMESFAKGCGIRIALVIGGASMNNQVRDLRANPRVVVGTPGRIKDHIAQKSLDLSRFNRVVLDEVDRMLDMGFIRDITAILATVGKQRQSLFFSATIEGDTEKLIARFARDPKTVSTRVGETADGVNQDVVWYREKDEKIDLLHDILIGQGCEKTIIFDDTKHSVEKLCKQLVARGFKADRIHGNKSQAQRSRAIERMKTNEINILVATDVAARGIDISDVTHVINYSQPNTYEDYVHRIGRTGRAGKAGNALTFLVK